MPQPSAQRRGLTILEVMISIGIASVGLLGALALLPLASTLAQIGLDEDTKSAVGRGAISQFKIMGGSRTEMWVHPNGTAAFSPTVLESFCIDPRYVEEYRKYIASLPPMPPPPTMPATLDFPKVATHTNPMRRITLRQQPGGVVMSLHLTREIFQTTDDLVFHPDEDKSLPPAQEYVLGQGADGVWGTAGDDDGDGTTDEADEAGWPGSDDNSIKRQSYGRMSWMVIVTPVLGRDSDLFNLAIVVFHSRDLDPDPALSPANERVSTVTNFYGAGITGGDVELTGTTYDDVNVRRDDWVMLSQDINDIPNMSPMPPTQVPGGEIYRWYRVIESDADDTDATRDVTLLGPDWDNTVATGTQATFLPGVVAVYERTIRLEATSLWSN